MKKLFQFVYIVLFLQCIPCKSQKTDFEPTVESLKQYETPEWFRDAKFGIWICWNAYTVPAVGDWYARNMYIEGHKHYKYHLQHYGHPSEFGYKDIIQLWKGEQFDAQNLVDLFVETGAKYVVGMANHHDNFDLWDSKHHKWNSVNYGPKRDIMREMQDAVKKYENQGIRWGITSHLERTWSWFQTNKGTDKEGEYAGVPYDGNDSKYRDLYLPADVHGDTKGSQPSNAPLAWRQEWLSRCKDLIDNYDPDLFYVDGGVPFPGDDKGKTGLEMISHLYNQNAARHNHKNEAVMCIKDWRKVMPNGEWGYYWDGIGTLDLERSRLPKIRNEPWQTDTSIGPWTYVNGAKYRSATQIIHELVDIVSKNGNLLLNVSPMSNGLLDTNAYELLKEIGAWMKVNGESIYGTRPWKAFGKEDVRIVTKGNDLIYVTLFNYPENNELQLDYLIPEKGKSLGITYISVLGNEEEKINWQSTSKGLHIQISSNIQHKHALVVKIKGSGFSNFDEVPLENLYERTEELKLWWQNQRITELNPKYMNVTSNSQNRIWVTNQHQSLLELVDAKEVPIQNKKALDVTSSKEVIAFIDLDGTVFISENAKEVLALKGMKAKRIDMDVHGTIWVITHDSKVAYYGNDKWNVLGKKAEDIGVGQRGKIAIISNGQLELFEGNEWRNLGGENLCAVDISLKDDVMVTVNKKGTIALHDGMDWATIDTDKQRYSDVACGLKNDDETVVLINK